MEQWATECDFFFFFFNVNWTAHPGPIDGAVLTEQCACPPHHIREVRSSYGKHSKMLSLWPTIQLNNAINLASRVRLLIHCFCLPLSRERKIPFFWSTNVDPLMKLDTTAITIPATGNETPLGSITLAVFVMFSLTRIMTEALQYFFVIWIRKWHSAHVRFLEHPDAPSQYGRSFTYNLITYFSPQRLMTSLSYCYSVWVFFSLKYHRKKKKP